MNERNVSLYPSESVQRAAELACQYTHSRECRKCHGSGEICGRFDMLECWPCGGTGEIEVTVIDGRKLAGLRRRAAKVGWDRAIADTQRPDDTCSSEVAETRCWAREQAWEIREELDADAIALARSIAFGHENPDVLDSIDDCEAGQIEEAVRLVKVGAL